MSLELQRCEWMDDWFVLHGGGNWASVEGTAAEWLEVAAELEAGKGYVRHKRVALYRGQHARWVFYSPRNAVGDRDYVHLSVADGAALAAQIRATVGAAPDGEAVRSDHPAPPTAPPLAPTNQATAPATQGAEESTHGADGGPARERDGDASGAGDGLRGRRVLLAGVPQERVLGAGPEGLTEKPTGDAPSAAESPGPGPAVAPGPSAPAGEPQAAGGAPPARDPLVDPLPWDVCAWGDLPEQQAEVLAVECRASLELPTVLHVRDGARRDGCRNLWSWRHLLRDGGRVVRRADARRWGTPAELAADEEVDAPCVLCLEAIESGDRFCVDGMDAAHAVCVSDVAAGRNPRLADESAESDEPEGPPEETLTQALARHGLGQRASSSDQTLSRREVYETKPGGEVIGDLTAAESWDMVRDLDEAKALREGGPASTVNAAITRLLDVEDHATERVDPRPTKHRWKPRMVEGVARTLCARCDAPKPKGKEKAGPCPGQRPAAAPAGGGA